MTPRAHARYLEYRERHRYFARAGEALLTGAAFLSADAEHEVLEALGEARSDEEEARLAELRALLHLD